MMGSNSVFCKFAAQRWGAGWQTKAAAHYGVDARTVRRWVAGARIPTWPLDELTAWHLQNSTPNETTLACRAALDPAWRRLRDNAMAQGWTASEIAAAIISLATADGSDAA